MYVCASCGGVHQRFRSMCDRCDSGPNTLRFVEDPNAPVIEVPAAHSVEPEVPPPPIVRPAAHPFVSRRHEPTVTVVDAVGPTRLCDVVATSMTRRSSGIGEIDRLLGGGIVDSEGTIIVTWGDGGSGKSTLLTELLVRDSVRHAGLYAGGEEASSRVAMRAGRLGIPIPETLYIEDHRDFDRVIARARDLGVRSMVLDSLQVFVPEEHKTKEALVRLISLAKDLRMILWVINHANASGGFYGRNAIKHEFDAVLKFCRVWKDVPGQKEPVATPFVDVRIDTKNRLGVGPEAPAARFEFVEATGRLVPVDTLARA